MAAVGSTTFDNLGLTLQQDGSKKKQQLGQEEFLKLMTTQLQNQDPTKPMDNAQFLGQIAQFSTVSGIQQMQESFSAMATSLQSSQALQGAQMVGRGVLVPSKTSLLPDTGAMGAAAELPSGGTLRVDVLDSSGQVVRRLDLGTREAGLNQFTWDGNDESGKRMEAGTYTLRAELDQAGATQSVSTYGLDVVDSVSLGSDGLRLNLSGLGATKLADVRQIF
jgi:flagellar basal-body rod modification protein FlgD